MRMFVQDTVQKCVFYCVTYFVAKRLSHTPALRRSAVQELIVGSGHPSELEICVHLIDCIQRSAHFFC